MQPASRSWVSANSLGTEVWDETEDVVQSGLRIIPPAWHQDARCSKLENPDAMFFPEIEGTNSTLTPSKLRIAKAFCSDCPVFQECLTHALTKPERHGVWAGTSKRVRAHILKLIEMGEVTVSQVVSDYMDGREERYESCEDDSEA